MGLQEHVWAYVELDRSGVTDLSLQGLAVARELADRAGRTVGCVVLGTDLAGISQELIVRGGDVVYRAEDPRLGQYLTSPFSTVLIGLCRQYRPEVVIFPASTQGSDLAATTAASLGTGSVLNCGAIHAAEGVLRAIRREYDGNVWTKYEFFEARPQVFAVSDGIAEAPSPVAGRGGEVIQVPVVIAEEDVAAKVLRSDIAARTVNLRDARVIVAAGAGLGTKENFSLVQELAELLGGEVGTTRAAVDAGWAMPDRQIGQTGVKVRPELYIACGISGAIQHRVGMEESGKIVSINIDPNAPIFRISHYGIVGDVAEVLPKLIQLLRR